MLSNKPNIHLQENQHRKCIFAKDTCRNQGVWSRDWGSHRQSSHPAVCSFAQGLLMVVSGWKLGLPHMKPKFLP